MGYGWHMGGGGWLWPLAGLLCLAAVVVLVVWAVTYLGRTHSATPSAPSPYVAPFPARPEPLDILRERFARGDITLDEFETAKRALGYPSSPPPPTSPGAPPTA
jgi:putative membrane protein